MPQANYVWGHNRGHNLNSICADQATAGLFSINVNDAEIRLVVMWLQVFSFQKAFRALNVRSVAMQQQKRWH